jgi:hypothetical protein
MVVYSKSVLVGKQGGELAALASVALMDATIHQDRG